MNKGFEVVDSGHTYTLMSLDETENHVLQTLQFVKRHDPDRPTKFPGNENSYPGTTMQCVIRALCDRVRYLDGQKECPENTIALAHLRAALYQFEKRAAERHGKEYDHSPEFAEVADVCSECGHTVCDHTR